MGPLRSKAVEQSTLSSPLRIFAVADGETATNTQLSDQPAALIDLVTPDAPTEYRLGYQNFYVITRYNRSSFYAAAVMDLAEALADSPITHSLANEPGCNSTHILN